ncbi:MAG: CinA family nicotinamide mononucleotide deamidase-related protein [Bacteroidetes bacterium]|nr:CinA family nicotinamide mononucleotide deamidase-related protein [Bacteroidota bacterium]
MKAEIITIGDEILIGQITDTNSQWIATELNKIGVEVYQITSISDDKNHIKITLDLAIPKVDIVIITGGLGPTNDDVTKNTLTEYFDDYLVLNPVIENQIKAMFAKINYPFTELNRNQAKVPSTCIALPNDYGTAPGMWFYKNNKVIISLPGVPTEMKSLMLKEVLPRLKAEFKLPFIIHKTINTYGMGESMLAELIKGWEDNLPNNIKLAYLPNFGKVRLRLSAKGFDFERLKLEVDKQLQILMPLIKEIYVGEDDDSIVEKLAEYFTKNNLSLAVAESVTGGNISHMITSVAGSSNYFKGSVVAYTRDIKENVLKVNSSEIDLFSTVSKEVSRAMVLGVQHKFKTDFAIATTGNAGPSTEINSNEIGKVFIAIACFDKVTIHEFNFGNSREKVIQRASNKAFELLRKEILKNNENSL